MNVPTTKEFEKYFFKVREEDMREIEVVSQVNKKYYPYIGFSPRDSDRLYNVFSRIVEKARKLKRLQGAGTIGFLDVGAGTGRIVRLAKFYGFSPVCGVECDNRYVVGGRLLHGLSNEELIHKDAFELDMGFFWSFDVIYTYMPIRDNTRMGELHINLVNKTLQPTVFAEMLPDYYPLKNNRRMITEEFIKIL